MAMGGIAVASEKRTIWPLTDADAEAAAALLARAFVDEPIFAFTLPDRAARRRLCPPLFAANLRHACHHGEALAIGAAAGQPVGVAYWVARPEPPMTAADAVAFGFAALAADWGPTLATLGGLEATAVRSLDDTPQPWRYLGAIGVEPARQGEGFGSALLGRLLADAAAAGVAVGLMTDRPENVPFYRRAGFLLAAEGRGADGTLPWWSFRTPPP